jgi:hypothetical protein
MFERCPKCSHQPLPADQALPAACPGCGVILAKVRDEAPLAHRVLDEADEEREGPLLLRVPDTCSTAGVTARAALWLAFAVWAAVMIRLDVRTGEFNEAFLHRPLLVFHEAGHVIFGPFGEWMTIFGGTAGQLLMPAIMAGALLWTNRDPFGASIGLWLLGVSLLDVAPYVYDALHPQLVLLNGSTGEDGGHDWIFLLETMNARQRSQGLGLAVHHVGVAVIALALAWGALLLALQWRHRTDTG